MGDKWHVLLSPPSLPPSMGREDGEMGGSSQFRTKMKGGTLGQLATLVTLLLCFHLRCVRYT